MLFLLSPAKTLDFESPLPALPTTLPAFDADAARLVGVLRRKSPRQVAALMDLSDKLAQLNVDRYAAWRPTLDAAGARPAVLAFAGDVYDGLRAGDLAVDDLAWAQDHLCILSGLYGLLRPLDRLQPYRLEMGTSLAVGKARNLYQYWGARIAEALNQRLAADATPVVVNLASQEYFRAVDTSQLRGRVIECVFEEDRGDGDYRIVSFFAKKARGAMARFAIERRIRMPRGLEEFDRDGYVFAPAASAADRLVFRRTMRP